MSSNSLAPGCKILIIFRAEQYLSQLNVDSEFFDAVHYDLKTKDLLMLETEDDDSCIETKAEVLIRTLFTAQAKRQAYIKLNS